MADTDDSPRKVKRSPFPATFYVANVMEIFERMAWYGFFAVSSLYMTSPVRNGGLGLDSVQRGALQGIIPFLLYLFPVVTGALADRYGYRKMFFIAFAILSPAYLLLGQFKTFVPFFFAFLLVAVGAATFKPVVVGTVSRTTDDTNKGLGFGVFYTIVNIGGFVGPIVAGMVRAVSWDLVFVMSAVWIAVNFIPTAFFYKEPTSEASSAKKRSLKQVMYDAQSVLGNGRFALTVLPVLLLVMLAGGKWIGWTFCLVASVVWIIVGLVWDRLVPDGEGQPWFRQRARVGNWPFVVYLLVLSGFWAIFNQIFITMPEYIRDFVDTSDLVELVSVFGPGAVDFLAAVNVDSLAETLGELVREHGAVTLGDDSRAIFFELVHQKVRVPEAAIVADFAQLSAGPAVDDAAVRAVAERWSTAYRQVNPEYLINLDAGAIIVFQIVVSSIIQRWRPFPVLVVGTLVCGAGLACGSIALTGILALVAILVFAFGEMIASPKSQEYVARIAPPDKVALFMGYYFVSVALGNLFGGILSGWGYGKLAREQGRPDLMWLLFGAIGLVTALALFVFNKTVVPRLEASRSSGSTTTESS